MSEATNPSLEVFAPQASFCALVTPMHSDGSLNLPCLQTLIKWHRKSGTHGVVLAGTTGEGTTLSLKEREQLITAGVQAAAQQICILVGTGTSDQRQSIELSQQAQELGADACMIVTPPYSRPPQEGLYRHFMGIADQIRLPIMLYNVPHRTASDLLPETVLRLCAHPQISALKESLGADRFAQLHALLGSGSERGCRLYAGTDEHLRQVLQTGADGVVSVTANLVPAQIAQLCSLDPASSEARDLDTKLQPLHQGLFAESNPISVKWAMQTLGLLPKDSGIRLPLIQAGSHTTDHLGPILDSIEPSPFPPFQS
ncbi:MAG: 4-hydroxy-tetrahydrodipicolinate synthase [Gammaproteobacteria bacterium]